MRTGIRARVPARSDLATNFTGVRPQLWGEPLWAVSPWLENGPGDRQNKWANLHNHNSSQEETGYPTSSIAFSVIGENYTGKRVTFTGEVSSGGVLTVSGASSNDIAVGMAVHWENATGGAGVLSNWRYNFINSFGSGTGGNGTYNLLTNPGAVTSRAMSAQSRTLNADGQPAYSKIADPVNPGRWCYQTRIGRDDPDAAGQNGRKVMPRLGDQGSEASNGLNVQSRPGDVYMAAWSVLVPAATRALYENTYPGPATKGFDQTLIFQTKTGQPTGMFINLCSPSARDYFATYIRQDPADDTVNRQSGTGTGPNMLFKAWRRSARRATRFLDNFPADTWLHHIMLLIPGVEPWATNRWYGEDPDDFSWGQCSHNGYAYCRVDSGGTSGSKISGATPPTHTTTGADVVSDSSPNDITWRCVGPIPAEYTSPRTVIWTSTGEAAFVKGVDTTETNWAWPTTGSPANNADYINSYWGWYTLWYGQQLSGVWQGTYASNSRAGGAWDSGDYKTLLWKDVSVARPALSNNYRSQLPSDALLTHWFDVLRSR